MLYFSSENNCAGDNVLLSYLMFVILIIGYFHLMIYTFILGFLLFIYLKKYLEKTSRKMHSYSILRNLPKTKFSSALFSNEECIICWLITMIMILWQDSNVMNFISFIISVLRVGLNRETIPVQCVELQ